MLIPEYWGEARLVEKSRGKSVVIRRFGWSNRNQEDADSLARERARKAMRRVLSGETLPRYEPRRGYNGAEGVPIREEILARSGDAVITRNSYGAHCLNTPDALFADVDFFVPVVSSLMARAIGVGLLVGGIAYKFGGGELTSAGIAVGVTILAKKALGALRQAATGLPSDEFERQKWAARQRIEAFIRSHPDWLLRVYETPAGYRVLALHRPFSPDEPAVQEFFDALQTDPLYRTMCSKQSCFRARLTPKPWRMDRMEAMHPRIAWPVTGSALSRRRDWTERYESEMLGYAACRFVFELGEGRVDPKIDRIRALHDERSHAEQDLPLA